MTRIRRINVSQVEGGGAENTDINEIRPNGETAFYIDNNNKLTMMMFDGVRTHLKSKVLSPGVMFGSNADAGDGSGADTIKLIPDANLHYNNGSYGNNQHIVVDPTGPNHIHLRAGGTIDSSNVELYLGGEQTFVRVSDNTDDVVIRTSVVGEGVFPYSWTFDNGGKLTLPGTLEYANGTLATGGGLLTPPDTDYIIGTQGYQTVSAEAMGGTAGQILIVDTTFVDDITVVQPGWQVNAGSPSAPIWLAVAMVIPGATDFSIDVPGFEFVVGSTYSFRNPVPVGYDWTFGLEGVLSTPGNGTISHLNNDLKIEVAGTDVIVLRTAGGDTVINSDGSMTLPGGSSITDTGVMILGSGATVGEGQRAARIGINGAVEGVAIGAGTNDWLFTNDGSMTLPGGITKSIDEDLVITTSYSAMSSPPGPATRTYTFGANGTLTVPETITSAYDLTLRSGTGATVNIESNGGTIEIGYQPNPPLQIYIGTSSATLGEETKTYLNTNRLVVLADAPASSVGKAGDTNGLVAVDSNYIYRCTGDYNGTSDIWKRVALTGGTW